MGRKKKSALKRRSESTYATTSGQVSEIGVSYDPATDTVSFTMPVENTYHVVSSALRTMVQDKKAIGFQWSH